MYEVIVGNIGSVYIGYNVDVAHQTYLEYMRHSIQKYGRAAGEPVTMLKDGVVVNEYVPNF